MKILILDDDQTRHKFFNRKLIGHSVTNVETAADAIKHLSEDTFDAIFLDHDLGGEIFVNSFGPILNTGYAVAKWLSENPEKQPKQIFIHSLNPVGADNMKALLPDAALVPGCWVGKNF